MPSAPRGPADSFDARGLRAACSHTFLTLIQILDECLRVASLPLLLGLGEELGEDRLGEHADDAHRVRHEADVEDEDGCVKGRCTGAE